MGGPQVAETTVTAVIGYFKIRRYPQADKHCDDPGPMAAPVSLQELARPHVEVVAKGTGGNTKFTCNTVRKRTRYH